LMRYAIKFEALDVRKILSFENGPLAQVEEDHGRFFTISVSYILVV